MPEDEDLENDLADPEEEITIRGKWIMDDAETLSEAARQLRDYASWLEKLEEEGYQLTDPVRDDYGFAVKESE